MQKALAKIAEKQWKSVVEAAFEPVAPSV